MKIALGQKLSAQRPARRVVIAQKRVLDDDPRSASSSQMLDEVFQKEISRLPCFDREVLLNLRPLLAAERRVCKNEIKFVALAYIGQIFRKRVGMLEIGSLHPVQNHVHDADNIGEALFFLAEKRRILECLPFFDGFCPGLHVLECFAEESRRAAGTVINGLADFRRDHFNHRANQWTRGIILAAIASGIAHAMNPALVQMGHFVLFFTGLKVKCIDLIQDIPQRITAAELTLQFPENFPDLVLDGVERNTILFESLEIREKATTHKINQVVAGLKTVFVNGSIFIFGNGPSGPAVFICNNRRIASPIEFRCHGAGVLKIIQILQK
ncbi:hypothetical protein SDC9_135594 [bioreactor metagenome]|uniref:Uncharacterized protein n=1 Tax=bioreactor metagenome TaxID=1076179 RepID=A0A645DG88_9ZZZZ